MEEVDSIIFHFLRQLNIDFSENTKYLTELPVETIVFAVSKCLNTINPMLKAPKTLPPGISHRIEVAAQIATMCKDLGYKSEVGYQTFLYYNEADLRKVFMFLIECLPTETDKTSVLPSDKKSVLWRNIKQKIIEELNSAWIPPCCTLKNRNLFGEPLNYDSPVNKNAKNPNQPRQLDDKVIQQLINSIKVLEKKEPSSKTILLNKEQDCIDNAKHSMSQTLYVEEKQSNEFAEVNLKAIKEEAVILRQQLNVLEKEKRSMDIELQQIQKANEQANLEVKELENITRLKAELGITNNEGINQMITKLKKDIEKLHGRSDECTHRNLSLKAEIETLKHDHAFADSERNKRLKAIEALKGTARVLKEEYRKKDQAKGQLRQEYEKLNKGGTKRSTYTKRIMEIIGNVAKQKIEIEKILGDTKQIQKEINNLNGQLDRSFSVADETLFRDAKKDDQAKKAYKLLALLHSECDTIVSLVKDTGGLSRDIVDLEDHIEAEKSKRTEDTLKKIQSDLIQMHEEAQAFVK